MGVCMPVPVLKELQVLQTSKVLIEVQVAALGKGVALGDSGIIEMSEIKGIAEQE